MTESTQLEEKLHESSEFMRTLFESAPDAIIVANEQGEIVRINARTESMFGYDRDDLIGKPLEILIPDRYRQRYVGHRDSYFAKPAIKQMSSVVPLFGKRKNGPEFPVDIMLSPLRATQGNMVIAVVRDITDRKQAEDALNCLMHQREDFVATLTHDLKTPVLAANRAVKYLIEGDFGAVTDEQITILQTILHSNEAMYSMVSTLLEVYRYDSGVKQIVIALHDLAKEIENLVQELSPLAQSRGITMSAVMPNGAMPVPCDAAEIRRVVQNLLDNALKFTRSGGKVEVRMEQSREITTIAVRDTGKGISDENTSNLFQRFWAPPASGRNYASTGLGLYLCRKIVELHGGAIRCESTYGVGSAFSFTIRNQHP